PDADAPVLAFGDVLVAGGVASDVGRAGVSHAGGLGGGDGLGGVDGLPDLAVAGGLDLDGVCSSHGAPSVGLVGVLDGPRHALGVLVGGIDDVLRAALGEVLAGDGDLVGVGARLRTVIRDPENLGDLVA